MNASPWIILPEILAVTIWLVVFIDTSRHGRTAVLFAMAMGFFGLGFLGSLLAPLTWMNVLISAVCLWLTLLFALLWRHQENKGDGRISWNERRELRRLRRR